MEDSAASYLKAVTTLVERVAVLEAKVDRHDRLVEQYGAQLAGLQASIDKISEKMAFVDRLEAMDASMNTLVRTAKGILYTFATGAAILAAFKAGDIGALQSLIGGLQP